MESVELFNSVRDLPYHCPENKKDKDYRCWGKHRILYSKLKNAGYTVRYRVCEFFWNELKLPKEVSSRAPRKKDFHLYLEINLEGKWIILDCSDDLKLNPKNLWDGKKDTKLSVKCRKKLSPKKSAEIEKLDRKNYDEILKEYNNLYKGLNKFIKKIRKN